MPVPAFAQVLAHRAAIVRTYARRNHDAEGGETRDDEYQ